MGRKWNKKKKQQTSNGAPKENKVEKPKRERADPQGYVVVKKENKDFETFYKTQQLVPECEWPDFMKALQSSLPAAFRITGNTTQAKALRRILEEDFFKPLENISEEFTSSSSVSKDSAEKSSAVAENGGQNASGDGEHVRSNGDAVISAVAGNGNSVAAEEDEPIKPLQPKCLPWYPSGLAYQLNLSRRDIRRCEAYWRLHQCLITETDTGSISRQEAVSMIPPLLLDVQPHHKVLDMCAAPGSKTAQLIEQLHSTPHPVQGAIPPGVVVANDSDNKRCYLLTHQAKRLQSPSIIITNHDAAFMPNIFYTKPDGSSGKIKYDRILCDVPCSGDGTLRKNCDVWAKWNPVNACNLHGLQLRIARRGLELLSVGGRMVYSTCSLSPMENEAVLQRLLLEADGAVEIVDQQGKLPGLKYRPGLTTWTVMTKDMEVIPSPEHIPLQHSNIYHKHLFPADKDLHMERCLRLLPHHQDTGGFFVAVLQKNAPLPGEKAEEPAVVGDVAQRAAPTQRTKQPPRKRRCQGFKEEPYYYLSDTIAPWEKLYKAGQVTTPGALLTAASAAAAANVPQTEPSKDIQPETATGSEDKVHVVSKTKLPEVSETEVPEVSETEVPEVSETEVPEVSETKVPEVSETKVPEVSETSTSNETAACKPEASGVIDQEQEDYRIWTTVSTFFGLSKDVPEASYANFMTRSREGKKRNLYFTNSLVRDIIDRNQDRMKIINTGVKVLVRTDNKGAACDFRLAQEGIQSILPLISRRKVTVSRSDLVALLMDEDSVNPPEIANMSQGCRDQAPALVTGSVLLEYCGDPTVEEDQQQTVPEADKLQIELVGWKGKSSMRCYVARTDRIHYLRLLRADTSKYDKNKFRGARAAAAVAADDKAVVEADADMEDAETKLEDDCKMDTN